MRSLARHIVRSLQTPSLPSLEWFATLTEGELVPFLVRLRPNAAYLIFMLIAAFAIAYGVVQVGGVPGYVITVSASLVLAMLAYPVIVSTVCRVPVLVVDRNGIRLPFMGIKLSWAELATIKHSTDLSKRTPAPVLLIIAVDPKASLAQLRPWLRREARGNLARHGTPIVLTGQSFDHSLDDITRAVHHHRPRTSPGSASY